MFNVKTFGRNMKMKAPKFSFMNNFVDWEATDQILSKSVRKYNFIKLFLKISFLHKKKSKVSSF